MYGEIYIRYAFSMRHLAVNISSPKVRELHDHFLWRERAQTVKQKYVEIDRLWNRWTVNIQRRTQEFVQGGDMRKIR